MKALQKMEPKKEAIHSHSLTILWTLVSCERVWYWLYFVVWVYLVSVLWFLCDFHGLIERLSGKELLPVIVLLLGFA